MNNSPEISPSIPVRWETVLEEPGRGKLEALLPAFFRNCRWFGGKARTIKRISIIDALPMPGRERPTRLLICRVIYTDKTVEDYLLPLSHASGGDARLISSRHPGAILAHIGPVALAVTTNLCINFLRKPRLGPLLGHCRILKLGKRLAVVEVAIRPPDDSDLVAQATATYSIPPRI